jgi:hypothetical protein
MRESQQLFFGRQLVSRIFEKLQHPAIQTKKVQLFGGFFYQIKMCQPIERKGSIQTSYAEEAGGWRHFCMKRLITLKSFQIFKIKI